MKGMHGRVKSKKSITERVKKEAPPFVEIRIKSAPNDKDRHSIKSAIKKEEPMNYLGVDCHKRKSFLTAMDKEGAIIGRWNIPNEGEELDRIFAKIGSDFSAVLEASSTWPVMYDLLEERISKVVLAHPLKVKAIAEAKIKNDKIDSKTLAHLLRADLIPEAYAPSRETRYKKGLLRYRAALVRIQTSVKNRIHMVLTRNHVSMSEQDAISDLFGVKGRNYLSKIQLGGSDKEILGGYLDLVDFLIKKIKSAEKMIRSKIKEDKYIRLLLTIPGIGPVFAPLIRYEIDRIDRFRRCKKFLCYCALVPGLYSSAEISRTTGIIKQGNKYLKWAFIEAVTPAIRSCVPLRTYYKRVEAKHGYHAARIALARKLARAAYHIMKDGVSFKEDLIREQ
jgi:transposase